MSIEAIFEAEIKRQYGSMFQFSKATDIPRPTLNTLLANGFEKSSVEIFLKICTALGLQPSELLDYASEPSVSLVACTEYEQELLRRYRTHKELGEAVARILGMETPAVE